MVRTLAVPLLIFASFIARAQVPIVTSVVPENGPVGTIVTISGINFGSVPGTTAVYFGAVKATVIQLSPTEIKTTVPAGATYKQVSVLVNGLAGISLKPFIVTSVNEILINTGSFSEKVSIEIGGTPYEVAAADLDADGKADMVVAGFKNITVIRNTAVQGNLSQSSFATPVNITTNGISATSTTTGDIDGDGKIDIVAISSAGAANTVSVFLNNTQPGVITATSFTEFAFVTGSNPQKVAVADLDGDGRPELITANGNNSISVLRNLCVPSVLAFTNPVSINSTAGTAETVTAADMDLDGKPDLVEYNFSNNGYNISVLRNQSVTGDIRLNSFALPVSFGSGLISDSDIATGDLDQDGKPDILANFGSNNTISVLKNLSTPGNFNTQSFATKVDFGTGASPLCGKAIADINGDGFPDIISTNRESNTWSVLQNKAQTGVINTASFLPKIDFATGQKPMGVIAADFDGDGMTDIAVVSRESKTAEIYRNQIGDPQISTFTPPGATMGVPLTLMGINFGNDPASLTVKINGTNAKLESVTPSAVTVLVPEGATTGPVAIIKKGKTYVTHTEFTALIMTVTGFSPATAFAGAEVTITGVGFSSNPGRNVVTIGSKEATITSAKPNELKIIVPAGATTGRIAVTTNTIAGSSPATDLVISKVSITGVTFPDLFTAGGPLVSASMSYGNMQEISRITFLSRGITQPAQAFRETSIELSPSEQVSFTIPADFFEDPIGLHMKFVIKDTEGNEIEREGYAWKKYPEGDESQKIPGLSFGKNTENYQIVAVPLELSNISARYTFRELGAFNSSAWRMYRFDGQWTYEIDHDDNWIFPGVGYWFIAKNETDINPGEGTTLRVTERNPFIIKLTPGWNMIGNPYNFTMSWDDVMSFNGNPESVGTLRQFEGGTFGINNKLTRFRGAFVRNQSASDIYIKIPVTNTSGTSRKRSEDFDPKNWEMILTLSDGRISNSLGGFGMNTGASDNTDRWDEVALPLPAGMGSFALVMRDAKEAIVKDVIPAADHYTWNGNVRSTEGVTITWDNGIAQQLGHGLWIELPGYPSLVDMRSSNEIELPPGEHSFRVIFGDQQYMEHIAKVEVTLVGDVATNPFARNSGKLIVPVNFTAESNSVQVNIFDAKGARTPYRFHETYKHGRNMIEWHDDFLQLSPGLYLLAISVAGEDPSQTFYRKFVVE
jgi:hypothetical protein